MTEMQLGAGPARKLQPQLPGGNLCPNRKATSRAIFVLMLAELLPPYLLHYLFVSAAVGAGSVRVAAAQLYR